MDWPNEQERTKDPFWTRRVPRPETATWERQFPPLSEAQAIWDDAHAKVVAHEARLAEMRAEREARERAGREGLHQAFLTLGCALICFNALPPGF
jgi:hypothetical protein